MSEPTRTSVPDPDDATRTTPGAFGGGAYAIAAPGGYELLGEIGSGGMGLVFRARDLDLAREVAVKILRPQYSPDSPTARRFLDEARITGRLQHPYIPAIYRVGTLADGRPYLAMKLIGGRTLDELLKASGGREAPDGSENQGADAPRSPLEQVAHGMLDRLDEVLRRGRFLAVFEHVAQAVGYAHRQGVIHRDLKPSNVMVGDFGEVQVLDWGIAKSGDRRQETGVGEAGPAATVDYAPGSPLATPQADLTQAGAILGTPAFMPPEQAIGAIDQIGRHSDVFGLGAILCVILTGKPPYVAEDAESNRRLAARGKLDDCFARLDASGAEPELVALAKRCLAPEPKDRPRDAGEVARAVAALRADAERRARDAEMDRAREEVQLAEERKRRRVKRALAAAVLGLVALAGVAGWWVDRERSRHQADEREAKLRREAEEKDRQLAYEREVMSNVNEVHRLLNEGAFQDENLDRWLVYLSNAGGALRRANNLLELGEPQDSLWREVARAENAWARDNRDRLLLVELDRIADSNEMRFLMPVSFSNVTARQFAAAFRAHGIDFLVVPTDEAVAWLKKHRFRDRLSYAIRAWQQSYPMWDLDAAIDDRVMEAIGASTAVAGCPVVAGFGHDPSQQFVKSLRANSPHVRLNAILKAATDNDFAKDWWDAVEKRDVASLEFLTLRPEFGRLSSRELSSLADGLNPIGNTHEVLGKLLAVAYDRFPGEFWVHFRLALHSRIVSKPPAPEDRDRREQVHRHLIAALAIRPNSAVARSALGLELLDRKKNDPVGIRWLESAALVEPSSPWPHFFLAMFAFEHDAWPQVFREIKKCVRADPDTAYFLLGPAVEPLTAAPRPGRPSDRAVAEFIKELIAIHPEHPGGYDMLGKFHLLTGDHRAALDAHREARQRTSPGYPSRGLRDPEILQLEAEAAWEERLPAILRGEFVPADAAQVREFAGYCAAFEKRYALATRVVIDRSRADPKTLGEWTDVARYAGYAVQASAGNGVDGDSLPLIVRQQYRRQALRWMRDMLKRQAKGAGAMMGGYINTIRDFAPVRDPEELAKLPPDERAEWEKLWTEFAPMPDPATPGNPEAAPPPREPKPNP